MSAIHRGLLGVGLVAAGLLAQPSPGEAQNLGTFRWQLMPFCNVFTYSVFQSGSGIVLSGSDDRCGASQRAASFGTAFINPDGSAGLGVTTIQPTVTGHFTIRLDLGTLSGPWSNDLGQSGTFVFLGPGP
jgi:hypothetical protein